MVASAIQSGIDLAGKKVLIVRLSALGDVIRTLPAVTGLQKRFPSAEFFWLVEKPSASLLNAIPGLRTIVIERKDLRAGSPWKRWRSFKRAVAEIQAQNIDISIDFHGVFKSGVFAWKAGIPLRIGYERGGSKEGHRWLINRRLALPNLNISRYERNLALARFIRNDVAPTPPPFQLATDGHEKVMAVMRNRPIIFFPGTSAHGRNKRWPARSWAWLYQKIAPNHPVRFSFGPADESYRKALAEILGSEMQCLPALSLPEMALALKASRMLVACDTGPLHLAAVQNVPVVALLGPSNPILNQPQTAQREVVLPGVACAPCRKRDCTLLICQDSTTPQRVKAAVERVLNRPQGIAL